MCQFPCAVLVSTHGVTMGNAGSGVSSSSFSLVHAAGSPVCSIPSRLGLASSPSSCALVRVSVRSAATIHVLASSGTGWSGDPCVGCVPVLVWVNQAAPLDGGSGRGLHRQARALHSGSPRGARAPMDHRLQRRRAGRRVAVTTDSFSRATGGTLGVGGAARVMEGLLFPSAEIWSVNRPAQ